MGKSSILIQFAENKFTDNYLTTIGVDFRCVCSYTDSKPLSTMARPLNSRYGILLDSNASALSHQPTTKALMALSWSMTLQIQAHLRTLNSFGFLKHTTIVIKTSKCFCLVTSLTRKELCLKKYVRSYVESDQNS